MADNKKYYEILGVPTTATKEEINAAFRKKAMQCHPDRFTDEKDKEVAKEKFQKLGEAHETLSDENRRQIYDSESSSSYSNSYDNTNPFANINKEFYSSAAQAQNSGFADLFQSMYSSSSSAPKTTDEILKRKTGGR